MSEKSKLKIFIQSKWFRKVSYFFLFISLLFLVFVAYLLIVEVPSDQALRNPEIKEASKIYDAKGRWFGSYIKENRSLVTYKDINPHIKTALIAAEDNRFFEHSGIDFRAVMRVFFKSILMKKKESGGGSTITQQLAKQLYPRPYLKKKNSILRYFLLFKSKIKEWIIALKLEHLYSKEEIMTMYLNKFEFINAAHGIQAASITYFNKNQSDLDLIEAATLMGMLQNPSMYNPLKYAKRCESRRNEVLNKIEVLHEIKLDSLKSRPLNMSTFNRYKYIEGPAPYFRMVLAKWLEKTIKEKNLKKSDGSFYDIYSDGLSINTTIDLDYQKYAEKASNEHMQLLQAEFWKEWKHKDAWTFEANEDEKIKRQASLIQKAKESERFAHLQKRYSGKKLEEVFEKEFHTAVAMKVYDLKLGEKTVTMTPMDSIRYHCMHLQNAFITLDPRSGQIKSWLGGLDYKYFKFDHATSRRSIGSTMKPFLYTTAMAYGKVKPCTMYKDQSYSIAPYEANFQNKELWAPHNATDVYTTLMYNLYHGLLYSKNSVTVKLLKDMGTIEPLRDLLDKVGISKNERLANGRLAVPQLPSVCLGAVDISLLQLIGAYSTFANEGVYTEPIFVLNIKDKNGKTIYAADQVTRRAIDPLYNAIMVDMLKNVVSGEFTMNLKSENGGKTGTTNDQSDGWFMGVTPTLVGGVWTGADDKWVHFRSIDIGQGYFTARPVFERFVKKLEADKSHLYDPTVRFPTPPAGFKELTNCAKIKTEPLPEFLRPKLRVIVEADSLK
jgi:penicillin-binding protein 1A